MIPPGANAPNSVATRWHSALRRWCRWCAFRADAHDLRVARSAWQAARRRTCSSSAQHGQSSFTAMCAVPRSLAATSHTLSCTPAPFERRGLARQRTHSARARPSACRRAYETYTEADELARGLGAHHGRRFPRKTTSKALPSGTAMLEHEVAAHTQHSVMQEAVTAPQTFCACTRPPRVRARPLDPERSTQRADERAAPCARPCLLRITRVYVRC